MTRGEQRPRNTLLKTLCSIGAVLLTWITLSVTAQAQAPNAAESSAVRLHAAHFDDGHKGKFRHRTALVGCPEYRGGFWRSRYECEDWRRSFSPFWAGDVTAGLLASAPTYYHWIPASFE